MPTYDHTVLLPDLGLLQQFANQIKRRARFDHDKIIVQVDEVHHFADEDMGHHLTHARFRVNHVLHADTLEYLAVPFIISLGPDRWNAGLNEGERCKDARL